MRHDKPNGQKEEITVVGGSSFGRYPKISLEKTYNMYISDGWLVSFAGYERILDILESGEGRGAFLSVRGNFTLAVVNSAVYRISTTFGLIFIGNLETTTGEVFIDENLNNQICIVDGLHAYIYDHSLSPNLTKQADAHFGVDLIPNYVTFHNTFFLFGNADTTNNGAKWFAYVPHVTDPTLITYRATLALETKPDYALAIKRIPGQGNNVLVLGRTVCEIHTQVADRLPYRRNSSVNVDYGVLSVSTIASSDEFIVWLGVNESNSPSLMVFSGQSAYRISTDGIDYLLGSLTHPEISTASFFRQDGHLFYIITFFGEHNEHYGDRENLTLMYDFTEKKFCHLSDEHLNYHPMRQIVYFNKENYFISLRNGSLYRLSSDITVINENLQNDDPASDDPRLIYDIQRIRICKTFRSPMSTPFTVNSFTIIIEQGDDDFLGFDDCTILMITEDNIRIFTEEASGYIQVIPEDGDPDDCIREMHRGRIDLSFSKDGCRTFSNTVGIRMRPLGHRQNILRWQRMGYGNEWTPKLRFWTKGRLVASGGVLEYSA
jgi:hypothetical protein